MNPTVFGDVRVTGCIRFTLSGKLPIKVSVLILWGRREIFP